MNWNQPVVVRLHQRHVAILVVLLAGFLALMAPMTRNLGASSLSNPAVLVMLLVPWVVGLLVLILEQRKPVRFWLAPPLLSVMAPLVAFCHNGLAPEGWARVPCDHDLSLVLLLNLFLIGMFTILAAQMAPRHCTDCKRWAMIPLRGLWGPDYRTPNTRWCLACGAKYWRTTEGEWREERRHTWFDHLTESTRFSPHDAKGRINRFDPDWRVVNPILTGAVGKAHATVSDGLITPEFLVHELRRSAGSDSHGRLPGRPEQAGPIDKLD
jgi:hypothetical protein